MSRTLRRTLSWLFVLVLIVFAVIGWHYLPGSGGLVDELRWLLARDYVPPSHFNRASNLILLGSQEQQDMQCRLFKTLLLDEDRRVVRRALTLLYYHLWLSDRSTEGLRTAFVIWLSHASLEDKIYHKTDALKIACQAVVVRDWTLPLTIEDQRWAVAGTLEPDDNPAGLLADYLALPCNQIGQEAAIHLNYLDIGSRTNTLDLTANKLEIAKYGNYQRPSRDQLVVMLTDPIDEVRWGAGRILAVIGDVRGMSAFCEWLKHNPRRVEAANELMTTLYGANWRQLCASGSAASQPGAGDGGG